MATDTRAPAVLFDIDGTLVDSNYLHVHAWQRAFTEVGLSVEAWRIHRAIGMDGSLLLSSLAGDADDAVRSRAKDLHGRFYQETAPLMRRLPGARGLLERVGDLGLQIVLATSAPEEELALTRNVLACEDLVSVVTSSEDVDTAKPQPGIVQVSLDRAGVDSDGAVFVGDAIWDMKASRKAGVPSIGLCSGGVSRAELEDAGARVVFDNALDLCKHLDRSPIAVLADTVSAH
ncbi:HAD family hydrolase [Mycobacterium sp. URHB0021]|jgi:phosphoglycolate phosphatase-like HAD superfamily hydrolase